MLRNYFKIAFRNFVRTPFLSSINIVGIVLGITCSTLILLYAWSEFKYDHFHVNSQQLYRITTQQDNSPAIGAVTPGPLAPELQNNFPEILNTARFGKWSGTLKTGNNLFQEDKIFFTDNSFLKMFDYPLVTGNSTTALMQPNDLLITENMAIKYFGEDWQKRKDLIGTLFTLNNEMNLILVGVLKNPSNHSSLQFDFLLSFQYLLNDRWTYQWGSYNFNTFVQLQPTIDIAEFNSKIKNVLRDHDKQAGFNISTQPLTEMYLHPLQYDYWTKQGSLFYINVFGIIGLGILIIACFNFINLSTAQSSKRVKEVGIRKTIGATRLQLFTQFLGESVLIIACSALIARGLIDLVLPYFNMLIGKELIMPSNSLLFFIIFLVITAVTGLLASLYPASLLSSFQPSKVLKGLHAKNSGKNFRQVLVVAQFSIALILMIGTIIIYQQLNFVQHKNLGFDKDQLMYVTLNGSLTEKEEAFREELLKQNEVISAAATTSTLVNNNNSSYIEWEGQPTKNDLTITQLNADPYLVPLMNMKVLHGRNFSADIKSDSSAYVINESAARAMGLNEQAIGKEVTFWGAKGKIVGILADFHFRPLHIPIEPLIMRYQAKTPYFFMLVKVKASQVENLIERLPALYSKFDQENPLSFGFVDEQLNKQYQGEKKAGIIVLNFSILAIFITCLGLLGLAMFSAEQRTKEFGIRKVMGASVANITQLLASDFLKLILIAILIATPLAWYGMSQWLNGFAYKIEVDAWVFALASLTTIFIALITISSQAIKTASINPVDSLRSE